MQADGFDHAWFESRAPRCTLIVFIDDATSRLLALRFAPSESNLHRTRYKGLEQDQERGHFYFGEKGTFLLCVDTKTSSS